MATVTATNPETPAEAPVVETPEVPEVPEKFRNEDGSLNQEALLKSYSELEKGKAAEEKPEDNPAEEKPEDKPEEGGVENFIDSTLKTAGIDRDALTAELQEKGSLSEESYEALAKAGFPKAEVDQYLTGGQAAEQAAAAEGEAIQTAAFETAGGEESFKSMVEWAAAGNLSAEQVGAYNALVESGNKEQAVAGVQFLKSLYVASEGQAPSLLKGTGAAAKQTTYNSTYEVTQAMADPRYGKDVSYTNQVAEKLQRSNVF